jgi:GT2 family glycosyltransferase
MSALAGISVVIPNYNGEALLPLVLPTVLGALEKAGVASEIIVADDCSVDQSLTLLSEKFPTVGFIKNTSNSGFSVTANNGIRAAKYDWVLLLNSDVKLEPGYFIPLLRYTQQPNVFGVMGRIIGWQNDIIQDGAKYPVLHGVKIKTSHNYLLKNEEAMAGGIYTMYLSGANAFLNKNLFLQIGGFNELFSPFYVEDFELSLRAWRLGYCCYYEHHAVCRHKTSTTIASSNKKENIKKIYNRNKMFLHAIHLDGGKRLLWFVQLFFESIFQLILLKKYYLSALSLFFAAYPKVAESRKNLNMLANEKPLLPVDAVVKKILTAIGSKEVQRF